ncbi:hypothetical protein AMS62_06070 [Bacillus sp. FJAT-18019]|nr:hypothetical protein AMS62_06070 [Bacillus sp. FJAT-18019]
MTSHLGNHDYVFPAYDEKTGPLELIYDPTSSEFEFELHRTNEYRISKELSGVRTLHDRYYNYAIIEEAPDTLEILLPYISDTEIERVQVNDELAILNENITEYQSGNIIVYETSEEPGDITNPQKVVDFLENHSINSGRVLLINMEGRMNVEAYLPINDHTARLIFTVENLDELETFVGTPAI